MSAPDGDRRTLPATPKRIQDFRKRGEVALSKELTTFATLAGAVTGGLMYAGTARDAVTFFMRDQLLGLGYEMHGQLERFGGVLASAWAPTAIGAITGYLLSTALQIGWPPALHKPGVDFGKVFSPNAFLQMINPKDAAGRTGRAIAKVAVVGAACAMAALEEKSRFMEHPALTPGPLAGEIVGAVTRLSMRAGLPLAVLAIVDFLWKKRDLAQKMRMTPEEWKREFRDQEGDPQIKRRRRQRMRELTKRRTRLAVQKADVVLVNPTEYAVALRYQPGPDRAPRVVAKGRMALAERIREFARQAGVPIIAEPPLTRLLYKVVPEGREIPSQLYNAVAEVLAYVYRLRGARA